MGTPVNDGIQPVTSIDTCQYVYLSTAPEFHFHSTYSPGVHQVTTSFYNCDALGNKYLASQARLTFVVKPTTYPPCTPILIDPVRSGDLNGPAVTSNKAQLVQATTVYATGTGADGVSQAVIEVQANHLGDDVQINLLNDANPPAPSTSSDQDGGLTSIGGNVNNLANYITVTADTSTSLGPTAFALYRAPTDFSRGTQDNALVKRNVTLQAYCPGSNGSIGPPVTSSVDIVRPPIVLVHGLWGDRTDWSNFTPTAAPESTVWGGLIPNASLFPLDYSAPVTVTSTTPSFSPPLTQVKENALGFAYNAPIVLNQIQNAIYSFGNYFNVAAVQADVIGHSMGGVVARTMALPNEPWNFLTNNTYGKGSVEKLITIGTPHLGSPLAVDLLPLPNGQDSSSCVRNQLATRDKIALQAANVSGQSVNGGVNDLIGDGQDTNGLSLVLQSLQVYQSSQPFPMPTSVATPIREFG